MATTNVFDGLIIRGLPTGTQDGINGTLYQEREVTTDDAGNEMYARLLDGVPIDKADPTKLAALFDRLNAGALIQITALTAQLATANTDAQTAAITAASALATAQSQLTAAQAQVADLSAKLAAATAPPSDATDTLLAKLDAIFATVPAEDQPQFLGEYAIVNVLVNAGKLPLAAAYVQGVEVPDALAAIKAQILAALQS